MNIKTWPRWKRRPFIATISIPFLVAAAVIGAAQEVKETTAQLFLLWRAA